MNIKFKILFVVLLTLFLVLIKDSANSPKHLIKQIEKGYKGIIIGKYYSKTMHLKIRTDASEVLDVTSLSPNLVGAAEAGDTIEKIINDNYVLLHKKGFIFHLQYKYIDKSYRNDRRWPEEWKDKWKEDNE